MTPEEYVENVFAIEHWFEINDIKHLSPGTLKCEECGSPWDDDNECPEGCGRQIIEPYHSKWGCEICGTSHCDVYDVIASSNPMTYFEGRACPDCVYYAEYRVFGDETEISLKDDDVTVAFIERLRQEDEMNGPFTDWVIENQWVIRNFTDLKVLKGEFDGISALQDLG